MAVVLCLVIAVVSYVGMSASRLLISLYAIELGAQPFTVGMLFSTMQAVPLLLSLPVGVMSDRFGTRWLMTAGFASAVAALSLVYFFPSLSMFYAASALNGLLLAINNVAVQHIMGVTSRPEQRARNFSNLALTGAAGNFVGPLIAGVSIDHFGYPQAALVMMAIAAAGIALLLAWGSVLPPGRSRAEYRAEDASGSRRPPISAIWPLLLVSALVQLCMDIYLFYMPVYGRGVGLSATTIGTVMAAFAAAVFAIRTVMPNLLKLLGESRLLAYSFFLAAAGFALAPLFHSPWPLALVSFLVGLGAGCGQPITMMLVVGRSAAGRAGEMLGLQLSVNSAARTAGPVLLGVVGSLAGLGPVFVVSALLMGAGGMVSQRHIGGARR